MLKLFSPSQASKNVLTVMSGTVLSQVIVVVTSPVLSRLYGSEQFGILALYMSISSLFVLIASARYEVAIVLPDEEKKAHNLIALSLFIIAGMTILSFILILIFRGILSFLFKESMLNLYLLFVPVSVLSMGAYQVFYNWSLRKKKFRLMSISRIFQSMVTVIISVVLGFSGSPVSGLVIGFIAGQMAAALFMGAVALFYEPVSWKEISYMDMKSAAKQYKDFPKVNTLHAMLDSLQNYGITFLISLAFGNAALGWYSFSYRILRAPLALIGSAFAQINYGIMSERYNKKESIRPIVVQTMRKIFFIGVPIFLVAAFFAPAIFKIVFGSEWEQAGVLARIMSPWLFVNFIISTVSMVPNVLNEQKKAFIINLCGAIFSLLVLALGTLFYKTIPIPLLYFSIASALSQGYIGWWFLKILRTDLPG